MRSTTWYVYSEVGRMLYKAGHVTGSREYSDTIDPFQQWPEKLREAAFWGIGTGLDDSSAYPRALLAITRDTGACAQFVREKETITREYGKLMLPDSEWAEQKKCVKQISSCPPCRYYLIRRSSPQCFLIKTCCLIIGLGGNVRLGRGAVVPCGWECGTAPYRTVQNSTVQNSAVRTVRYSTVQHSTVRQSTVRCT